MNFGGIEPEYAGFEKALFVVLPVPYDLTSTYRSGSRLGPAAILDASAHMELYDEELGRETYQCGIHTLPFLEPDARGPKEMVETIRQKTLEVVRAGKIPVTLGGEHSISFGCVQALKEKFPALTVLQLDAHADLRDAYQGSPYSHASVARRISECCPLVQAGIRSMSAEEAVFLAESQVKSFTADDILEAKDGYEAVIRHLQDDVYISVDLDVFDPAFMPATGTPEPGGIGWKEMLCLIRAVSGKCLIRGFDMVELSPIPGVVAPDFLAAKLIYRMMGYTLNNINKTIS
jgi:agmatinase